MELESMMILGRIAGLVEAWGGIDKVIKEEQISRIRELFKLLDNRFIVTQMAYGKPSERAFLITLSAF